MTITRRLTAKQERFAQLVASGETHSAAYRLAYDTNGASDTTVHADATRLFQNPLVSPRIDELMARYADVAEIDAVYVLSSLKTNVERAMRAVQVLDRKGNPTGEWQYDGAVANKALELLGKHLGMFSLRVEHAGQIVHTYDMLADLSLEDVKALALAYRALQEQKAQAIEGEVRVLETSEDVSSSQSGEVS